MSSQGFLFAESAIAETGLWCELANGIAPARWARLCRYLGNLSPDQLNKVEKRLFPNPDSLKSRLKSQFSFNQADCEGLPLVCIGPLDIWCPFGKRV